MADQPVVVIGASTFITVDPTNPFSKFTTLPIQIYQWTSRPQDEFRNIAAAAILVSEDYLSRLTDARPVKVRASVLASGGAGAGIDGRVKPAVKKAYEMAGVGPEDIDTAEVHDATAFGEIYQYLIEGEAGIGKTRLKVQYLNPYGASAGVRKADAAKMTSIRNRLGAKLRSAAGPAPPRARPPRGPRS